ncbi:hypothetical protein T492DRAFT_836957 [Pavlovales sp. CCMP2436]|nr:hypothetical protein T492DRAFT_836957 [Pavlovales sp. CCMP2436]
MDTPSQIVTNWEATMSQVVGVQSFGHCSLTFDVMSGKISAVYIPDPAYGDITVIIHRKMRLVCDLTDEVNVFWQLDMAPRPFANVALVNYIYRPVIRVRGGVIIDGVYSGVISPISRLTVLSDDVRNVTLVDFDEKKLPVVLGQDSSIPRKINGRSANEATVDFSSSDWTTPTGWRVTGSSTYQNNASFAANSAFDRNTVFWRAECTSSANIPKEFFMMVGGDDEFAQRAARLYNLSLTGGVAKLS